MGGGEARRDTGGRPLREGVGWRPRSDRPSAEGHGTQGAAFEALNLQRGWFGDADSDADDRPKVRVEIIGSPEPEKMRWLEAERARLLGLTQGVTIDNDEPPHSVNLTPV